MIVLETRGLTHKYGQGTNRQHIAIQDVSIQIEKGELVGIIGHTGSGKSTLIQHCNGLLKPDAGEVLLDGENIWKSKGSLRQARFKVGLCFQYPEYQLFEETVHKDIAFGPKNMGLEPEEIDRRVRRAAEFVGLKHELLEKSPFDLSGGEKRRAAIAGVMAMEPEILVLDEPTAGLDPQGRAVLLDLVRGYRKETGSTVLLVSHSMEDVASIADRVLVLDHARVALFDTVDAVFSRVEELQAMDLSIPEITAVFRELRDRGLAVSRDIYTVEQGAAEILRFWKGVCGA